MPAETPAQQLFSILPKSSFHRAARRRPCCAYACSGVFSLKCAASNPVTIHRWSQHVFLPLRCGRSAGLYHDVCGTLNGRRLADGTLLYGCTCNLSITLAAINRLQFDTGFPDAAFEVRLGRGKE